jgi:hypothetical protein
MAAVQASDNRGETRVFSPFSKNPVEPNRGGKCHNPRISVEPVVRGVRSRSS